MRASRFTLLIFVLSVGHTANGQFAQSSAPPVSDPRPVWRVSVKDMAERASSQLAARQIATQQGTIETDWLAFSFLDQRSIAVVFRQTLVSRKLYSLNPPIKLAPPQTYVSIFDIKKKRLRPEVAWHGAAPLEFLLPAEGSRFVATTGKTLLLLSATLEELGQQTLASAPSRAFVSASGRTLLLFYGAVAPVQVEVFDTTTLVRRDSWVEEDDAAEYSFSDGAVLVFRSQFSREGQSLRLRRFGGSWTSVHPEHAEKLDAAPVLLDAQTFALQIGRQTRRIDRVTGEVVFEDHAEEKETFRTSIYPSPDGRRFVGYIERFHGWNAPSLDIYPTLELNRLAVYDVSERRMILTLHTKRLIYQNFGWIRVAFSPDGSMLATLTADNEIQVFRLPGRSPASK